MCKGHTSPSLHYQGKNEKQPGFNSPTLPLYRAFVARIACYGCNRRHNVAVHCPKRQQYERSPDFRPALPPTCLFNVVRHDRITQIIRPFFYKLVSGKELPAHRRIYLRVAGDDVSPTPPPNSGYSVVAHPKKGAIL